MLCLKCTLACASCAQAVDQRICRIRWSAASCAALGGLGGRAILHRMIVFVVSALTCGFTVLHRMHRTIPI
jgi:hypothetical protein